MFDISKINDKHISELARAYIDATFVFGIDPLKASQRKQQKITKWIRNQYMELVHELPEDMMIFSVKNSDREILLFLKECLDLDNSLIKKKEDDFEKEIAALDESSKSALKQLLEFEFWPEIKVVGNDTKIIIDDTPAFRRILTLKNSDAVPMGKEGFYCQDLGAFFKKDQNRFCFYGELEDPVEETAETFALTFENVEVEIEVYNACNNRNFWRNPWDFLSKISLEIGMKADLAEDYCNAKEKDMLPLIREITVLEYWLALPKQNLFLFCELKKLARQYGYNRVEMLLGKVETINTSDDAFHKTLKKLISLLCKKQHEPLWRDIYNRITESQSEYPNRVEALCDKELLANARNDIQMLMEAKGYTGTYPDFIKEGPLKGVHLERSYDMTYFVYMEKRARYHIHCCESFDENDYLTIHFLCGTSFLKKDEQETDIYDCLFNAKGKRLFHTVHHYIPLNPEEDTKVDILETSVTIACKKAECIKLTKEERNAYYGMMFPGWAIFWWMFVVGGGMFGIAMTLVGMILCIITTAAFGFSIPEMLKEIPWWIVLAIGWIGFGGAMGIIDFLAHRK